MKPREMDSLDTVEMVMTIEEVLDIEIPGDPAEYGSPREMVDRLEAVLSNRRPNEAAAALLRKLARDRQQPELAEGLEGTWRREQIAAIVREVFRDID
jgi:Phosphopantetheine attachment site